MTRHSTNMFSEIFEIPLAIERLLERGEARIRDIALQLKSKKYFVVTTVARGSSDHAAAYLKYAIELSLGIPVASIGPSISSIYGKKLHLENAVNISISQSGKSPDIVKMAETAKSGGAFNISLTNNVNSPLSMTSAYSIDIEAGEEKSVAATKTFVNSVVAGLILIAHWSDDEELLAAIYDLPNQVRQALKCEWDKLADQPDFEKSLFILGRGPSMAIADEAALKFKETCQIHAESFSTAEVMHGPKSIIDHGFPLLILASRDGSEEAVVEAANALVSQGANVFITTDRKTDALKIPFVATNHPLTDPLLLIVCYYKFVEALARSRGLEPDEPPHLNKVTQTV